MLNRRSFLSLVGTCAAGTTLRDNGPEVAVTIDDFNWSQSWPLSPKQVSRQMLDTLEQHRVRITLFVVGRNVETAANRALLQEWVDAGHIIGNHTYSHAVLDSPAQTALGFEAEIVRTEQILSSYSTYRRIFRFPALKEGKTAESRDSVRAFLANRGYQSGAVTIDASDCYYSLRLQNRLHANSDFDVSRYRQPYMDHIADRSRYYDQLSRSVLGRSPRHTLLLHYSYLNACFLGDLLAQYRQNGWRLIDSTAAFAEPIFSEQPQTLPAGESLIWALAKQTGRYDATLRYPGEDSTYEAPKLDRLQL